MDKFKIVNQSFLKLLKMIFRDPFYFYFTIKIFFSIIVVIYFSFYAPNKISPNTLPQ